MTASSGSLLTNPYIIAIGSPAILLVLGGLGKAVIKGGLSRYNIYLGFDAALTAFYAAIVYLYDVARDPAIGSTKDVLLAGFLSGALVLFLAIILIHQYWEKDERKDQTWKQILWLGVVANILGFGLLVAFVLLVKGV